MKLKTALTAAAAILLPSCCFGFTIRMAATEPHFVGKVNTEWCAEKDKNCCREDLCSNVPRRSEHDCNRDMKLLNDFSFVDSHNVTWTAPEGFVIDGATIPKFLWIFFGSPYVGKYRRASVVHDYYCVRDNRQLAKQQDVHRMFYDAMRCDGVQQCKAWFMWTGVRLWWALFHADANWD